MACVRSIHCENTRRFIDNWYLNIGTYSEIVLSIIVLHGKDDLFSFLCFILLHWLPVVPHADGLFAKESRTL